MTIILGLLVYVFISMYDVRSLYIDVIYAICVCNMYE